jgi:anti-repressor protein
MSNNEIELFEFHGNEFRVILRNGEPGFVAQDACAALGIKDVSDAVARLDEADRGLTPIRSSGQIRNMYVINEPGLYELIFRSDKPAAREFRRWVTHEVLPAIRKTGRYEAAPVAPVAPRQLSGREWALMVLEESDARIHAEGIVAEQRREIEASAHKIESYDQFQDSSGLELVGTIAKNLRVGPNKLMDYLRTFGVLISTAGDRFNTPYQRHINAGRFVVIRGARKSTSQGTKATYTTHVTPKGVLYIEDLIRQNGPAGIL